MQSSAYDGETRNAGEKKIFYDFDFDGVTAHFAFYDGAGRRGILLGRRLAEGVGGLYRRGRALAV